MFEDGSVDSGTDDGGDGGQDGFSGHPAWQEFIGDAPQDVIEKYITPAFSKWDQGVSKRFTQVQQQYEPWKDVVKQSDPETAGFALNLLNALNNNPAEVVKQVSEYYKLGNLEAVSQGQTEPKAVQEVEPWEKEVKALKEHNALLTEAMLKRHQEEENAKADAWVSSEMSRLKEANVARGDFNESWVCAMSAQTGMKLDDAVKAYYEWRDQEVGKYRVKPLIMPGGGGAPGAGGVNPRKMDSKATNNLIVDLLNAHNAERNQ